MNYLWLIPYYISWHYSDATRGLLKTWKNFIWFFFHYFSISLLFETWLYPFERIKDRYRDGMMPRAIFESLIFNLISRVVGFFLRTFVIALGLIVVFLVICLGIIIFVLWILMPFVLGFILLSGFKAII